MIHADKCQEFRLPKPKSSETQLTYITRTIAEGFNLNTRICRYTGIHNLHSIVATMKRKPVPFTLCRGVAICPFTGEAPPYPVDQIFMTLEQKDQYRKEKTAKA